MKILSICDSPEMYEGLRLAGIEGRVVNRPEEFALAFEQAISDNHGGILIVAKSFKASAHGAKANTIPLIVEL